MLHRKISSQCRHAKLSYPDCISRSTAWQLLKGYSKDSVHFCVLSVRGLSSSEGDSLAAQSFVFADLWWLKVSPGCSNTELLSGQYSKGAAELIPHHTCQMCKRPEAFHHMVDQALLQTLYTSGGLLEDTIFGYEGNFAGFNEFWHWCVETSCCGLQLFVSVHHHFLEYC